MGPRDGFPSDAFNIGGLGWRGHQPPDTTSLRTAQGSGLRQGRWCQGGARSPSSSVLRSGVASPAWRARPVSAGLLGLPNGRRLQGPGPCPSGRHLDGGACGDNGADSWQGDAPEPHASSTILYYCIRLARLEERRIGGGTYSTAACGSQPWWPGRQRRPVPEELAHRLGSLDVQSRGERTERDPAAESSIAVHPGVLPGRDTAGTRGVDSANHCSLHETPNISAPTISSAVSPPLIDMTALDYDNLTPPPGPCLDGSSEGQAPAQVAATPQSDDEETGELHELPAALPEALQPASSERERPADEMGDRSEQRGRPRQPDEGSAAPRRMREVKLAPPTWQRDRDSLVCTLCGVQWSLLRRRHHCRGCGRLVCASCSNERAQLPFDYGVLGRRIHRICRCCVVLLRAGHAAKDLPSTGRLEVCVQPSSAMDPSVRSALGCFDLPIRSSRDAFNVHGVATVKLDIPASFSVLQLKLFFAKHLSIPYRSLSELDNRLEFRCARDELSSDRIIADIANEVLAGDKNSLLLLKYHVWASASDHAEAAAALHQQQQHSISAEAPTRGAESGPSSVGASSRPQPTQTLVETSQLNIGGVTGVRQGMQCDNSQPKHKEKQEAAHKVCDVNEDLGEGETCRICFDRLDPKGGRTLVTLAGCNHEFHLDCIGSFFNTTGGQMICPLCRATEEGQWLYSGATGDK
eukprot:scaffold1938_cov399-Prasinococcus_capsulatus_cf.AAC.21